jgi:carbon-monoxide dehydrogenase medium subunit
MKLPLFVYERAESVAHAIRLLEDQEGARLIAGGQSLIPILAFRLAAPPMLIDIGGIDALKRIDVSDDVVTLGALVRWVDIEQSALLASAMPILPAVIAHVAHYQIRNRGTVGGSLAHCDPAAEMPGLAVVCDAEIVVEGASGRRVVPAVDVLVGPLTAAIAPTEMIIAIRFPRWQSDRRWGFSEFSRRRGDFALAGVFVHHDVDADGNARDVHLGAIGAGDRPIRIAHAEAVIEGRAVDERVIAQAAAIASAAVDPPDDIHASAAYRRSLVGVLTERVLFDAMRSPAGYGGTT